MSHKNKQVRNKNFQKKNSNKPNLKKSTVKFNKKPLPVKKKLAPKRYFFKKQVLQKLTSREKLFFLLEKQLLKKKLAKYRKVRKVRKQIVLGAKRYRRKLWGHWQRNLKWRRRKFLPEITIGFFWKKPTRISRRWIFKKKRYYSGIMFKKRKWQFFTRWIRIVYRHKKRAKASWLHKIVPPRSKSFEVIRSSNKYLSLETNVKTPTKELKDFKFQKFSDKGIKKFTKTQHRDYNHIFDNLPLLSQDLPIFAMDLYNLYLHNLEQNKPVVVERLLTQKHRRTVNKVYKRLLVQYMKLLASFYTEAMLIKARKRTAAHNAVSLIKQFSRVAGSRTVNPLNKPRRWDTIKTIRFYLRHKHYKKFWRTKKSLFKMRVVIARMLRWLYNTKNSKYLLGTKLRQAFLGNYATDKQFIYKKRIKLHLKSLKIRTRSSIIVSNYR
jgi:hypothetical protein